MTDADIRKRAEELLRKRYGSTSGNSPSPAPTPSPETDAAILSARIPCLHDGEVIVVYAEFARKLERQRDAARREVADLRASLAQWRDAAMERENILITMERMIKENFDVPTPKPAG